MEINNLGKIVYEAFEYDIVENLSKFVTTLDRNDGNLRWCESRGRE